MKSKTRGFSIIEVALVLGIAGLIFMMVFVALPSLWTSQRDADRKAKVVEFITKVKEYQTNNARGALPIISPTDTAKMPFYKKDADANGGSYTDWHTFVKEYITSPETLMDPTGTSGPTSIADGVEDGGMDIYVTECGGVNPEQPCNKDARIAAVNADGLTSKDLDYTLYVITGAICEGDQAIQSRNKRNVAALYVLERAGRYCYSTGV